MFKKQFLSFCLLNLPWDPSVNIPPYRSRLALISLSTVKSRRIVSNFTFFMNRPQGRSNSRYLLSKILVNVRNRPLRSYEPLDLKCYSSNFINFYPFRRIFVDINKFQDLIDFADSVINYIPVFISQL